MRLSCVRVTLVSRVVSNQKGLRRDSCWRHQLLWCLYRRADGPTIATTLNLSPEFTYYRNAVPPYTRDKTLLRIRSISGFLTRQNSSTSFCPLLVLLFFASSGVEDRAIPTILYYCIWNASILPRGYIFLTLLRPIYRMDAAALRRYVPLIDQF